MAAAWIGAGLALALAGRILSGGRPDRTWNPLVVALFLVPFGVLASSAYRVDAGGRLLLRVLRCALFAFLAIVALYFGVTLGGLAAAAGAVVIYTRFIRPRPQPNDPPTRKDDSK